MKRGRRTSFDNIVPLPLNGTRPKLAAPSTLTKDEQSVFNLVVAENHHLTALDIPMLTAFAQAAVKTFKLAEKPDTKSWGQSARVMAMLATRLRITPQSTATPQTLARHRRDRPPDGPPPWEHRR